MAIILISTAYLPPAEYFAALLTADSAIIEKEENYIKQTYRNRCYILSTYGLQALSVPVYLGSFHKTQLKDIRIDYSKRWQQVHLRAIQAAYSSSPYFIYYYELLEESILKNHEFLLDLNNELLFMILKILKSTTKIEFTARFTPPSSGETDLRYRINPKTASSYILKEYNHVFSSDGIMKSRLSIIDLIFNTGPETAGFL